MNTFDYDVVCRGNRWHCPSLKLYGYASEEALYVAMDKLLKRRK